ncbi:TPA: DUF551 domain-containing protein [Shigella flexneri]|uniref:DUF551 domain-containing protein n=2 Tax=Shigella flexneri TaxID=623 RepID=A0A4P7TR91_SHIFM|nr:DUF551 domain-containing protein [Shigella flexneri]EFF1278608.1 DUF551 domain-containing protein [Escherichia coli]HAY9074508.1 DUF551 domain-containing protein [Shigella boydii]ABF02536.1 putative bacteriophage protein [Shigella flexneri 5 str. 8401]EAA2261101.1 DUF551 domain-containing protein [Shigella flexneri]EAA4550574.1 DUF551 domain-containing protein [Shigella flexneri]
MTTITKERLLTIKQWRETYGPGSNVVLPAEEAEELARIALASLEAEPVAYIFKHPAGKLFWALTDESNKEQADVIPVYAAAPASVVPDNASEPLAYAYKELTPEIMRNHLAVFERYGIAPNDSSTTIQALRIALDGIERSDAMLHGAEPVSQTYKLPPLSSNEVNDAAWKLHNMLTEHGPLNGRQFNNLKGCFYEALKVAMRNYPVTPDGWISCSERMPEDTKMLLAFSQGQIVAAYWNWVMSPIDYKKYRAFTYLSGNILDDVTHWMPLLEPPEQDGE